MPWKDEFRESLYQLTSFFLHGLTPRTSLVCSGAPFPESFLTLRHLDATSRVTDELIYEATISTLKNPTQTPAWVFES